MNVTATIRDAYSQETIRVIKNVTDIQGGVLDNSILFVTDKYNVLVKINESFTIDMDKNN